MIEKRVNNILHNYQQTTVSEPNSYIKRTWISPLQKSIKDSDQMIPNFKLRKKKEFDQHFEEKSKVVKICNILNLNKKMHLFGQFMYCDFDGK